MKYRYDKKTAFVLNKIIIKKTIESTSEIFIDKLKT